MELRGFLEESIVCNRNLSNFVDADSKLNGLWKWDGNWTVMSVSQNANAIGTYGKKGIPSSSNRPGSRSSAMSWMSNGYIYWMFGGVGYGRVEGTEGTGYLVYIHLPFRKFK